MITRGELLKLSNEPYKLAVCKDCGRYPKRCRKDNGLCHRCMIPYAPIVEGLLLGWHPPKRKTEDADKEG